MYVVWEERNEGRRCRGLRRGERLSFHVVGLQAVAIHFSLYHSCDREREKQSRGRGNGRVQIRCCSFDLVPMSIPFPSLRLLLHLLELNLIPRRCTDGSLERRLVAGDMSFGTLSCKVV